MTKHFKRPLSILLAVLMVMSVFIAVPTVANATPSDDIIGTIDIVTIETVNYYIVGTMNNWTVSDAYKLTKNPNNSDEYMFTDLTVGAGTELKVKDSNGYYYPDGTNNNFTLNSAGTYDIYFRPDGNGNQNLGWHYGNILANNYREPAPTTYTVTWKNGDTTLETDADVVESSAPSYDGAEPTKAADNNKHYTFSGWFDGTNTYGLSDTLPNVTADVTYTAQFTGANHTWDTANAVWDDAPTAYLDDYYEDAYKANVTVICSDCGKERTFEANTEDRMGAIQEHSATCDTDGFTQVTVFATVGSTEISKVYQLDVVPAAHDTTHVVAKAATFEADGNIEYWRCGICGKYFSDEECTQEITQANTVIPKKVAVAQVGDTMYETFEAAVNALEDNGTLKILLDTGTNQWDMPSVSNKKNVTLDLNGKTLNQRFYVVSSDLTIKDSSAAQTGRITSGWWIQLYNATVTLESGTLNTHFWDGYSSGSTVIVKGGTIEAYASNGLIAFNHGGTVKIYGGTFIGLYNGSQMYITPGATNVYIYGGDFSNNVSNTLLPQGSAVTQIFGGKFHKAVPAEYCADGYEPTGKIDNSYYTVSYNGNPLSELNVASGLINDNNAFRLSCDYLKGTLLGVQKKGVAGTDTSSQETGQDIRFIACLDTAIIQSLGADDDYGFVVTKVKDSDTKTFTYENTVFENLRAGDDRVKTVSCKGTYNNVCGDYRYGNPTDGTTDYKYITCGVNGVDNSAKVVARFYVKKDGTYYYAKYAGQNYQYTGCLVSWADVA